MTGSLLRCLRVKRRIENRSDKTEYLGEAVTVDVQVATGNDVNVTGLRDHTPPGALGMKMAVGALGRNDEIGRAIEGCANIATEYLQHCDPDFDGSLSPKIGRAHV